MRISLKFISEAWVHEIHSIIYIKENVLLILLIIILFLIKWFTLPHPDRTYFVENNKLNNKV